MTRSIVSVLALAGLAPAAHADLVTIRFTGSVQFVDSIGGADFSDDFTVGEPVSGFLTIDDSVADIDDTINTGEFPDAIVGFGLRVGGFVGGYELAFSAPSTIRTFDNVSLGNLPQGDYITGVLNAEGGDVDGVAFSGASFTFGNFGNAGFDTQDPNTLSPTWDLNAFPDLGFFINWIRFERGGSSLGGSVEIGGLSFEIDNGCGNDLAPVTDAPAGVEIESFFTMNRDATLAAFKSQGDFTGGNPDGSEEIFLLDLASGQHTQITDNDRFVGGGPSMAFTADGSLLVFSAIDITGADGLHLHDTGAGTTQTLLTAGAAEGVGLPRISDDGSKIVFNASLFGDTDPATGYGNADGSNELFAFDRVTGVLTQLTNFGGNNVDDFAFSPTGDFAVFESENAAGNDEISRIDLATRAVTLITSHPSASQNFFDNDPIINADGTVMAFKSTQDLAGANPNGGEQIFTYNFDTESFRQFTVGDANVISQVNAITDNGNVVLFESASDIDGLNPDGPVELFRTSVAFPTRITDFPPGTGENVQAFMSGDGRTIVFESARAPLPCLPDLGSQLYRYRAEADDFEFTADLGPAGPVGTDDPFQFDFFEVGPFSIAEGTLGRATLAFPEGQGIRFSDVASDFDGSIVYFPGFVIARIENAGPSPVGGNFSSFATLRLLDADGNEIVSGATDDPIIATFGASLEFFPFPSDGPATAPGPSYDVYGMEITFSDDLLGRLRPDATISFSSLGNISVFGPCIPDLNGDGILDLTDINIFTSGFIVQDPVTDLDGNGIWDLTDINIFTSTFLAGCP